MTTEESRITTLLKRLKIFLPEGWKPDPTLPSAYKCATEFSFYSVMLKDDFSLQVYMREVDKDVLHSMPIPYEVMQAMYVEIGRFSISAEEATHIELLQKDRDEARTELDKLGQHADNAQERLYRANRSRVLHFYVATRIKQALVKCAWRLHNQRETNRKVRAAFKQWAGSPNSGDVNMAFTAEMCRALKIKPSDIPINLDGAILNKPGDDLIDTVKSARSLLEPASPEGWVGTNPQFSSKNGF